MYVLNDIEKTADDLENTPEDASHKLTFRVVFTIKDVPDTFTGVVYETADNELILAHFNKPKGNVRKIITLKNKLPQGVFLGMKVLLFRMAKGQECNFPVSDDDLKSIAEKEGFLNPPDA